MVTNTKKKSAVISEKYQMAGISESYAQKNAFNLNDY
jgi:hypothetical protein